MQHDMTTHPKGESTLAIAKLGKLAALTAMASALVGAPVWAQNYPITAAQKETARAVAQQGVPLSELAANAPERYTVKSGDTLWAISRLYLKSPWRWPELWGMNMEQVRNPHLIYPGQVLVVPPTGDEQPPPPPPLDAQPAPPPRATPRCWRPIPGLRRILPPLRGRRAMSWCPRPICLTMPLSFFCAASRR